MAAPMPRVPPVTNATRPVSLPSEDGVNTGAVSDAVIVAPVVALSDGLGGGCDEREDEQDGNGVPPAAAAVPVERCLAARPDHVARGRPDDGAGRGQQGGRRLWPG